MNKSHKILLYFKLSIKILKFATDNFCLKTGFLKKTSETCTGDDTIMFYSGNENN